jgi:hypothetical protein
MTTQAQKSTIFQQKDDGSELIGLTFIDDGQSFRVTGTHKEDGQVVIDYKDKKGADHYSTMDSLDCSNPSRKLNSTNAHIVHKQVGRRSIQTDHD